MRRQQMFIVRAGVLWLLVLGNSACDKEPVTEPGGGYGSVAPMAQSAARHRTFDEHMASIADEVPGFAGVYFDSVGDMVVRLQDPSRLSEATAHLIEFTARYTRSQAARQLMANYATNVRTISADYDFRQLHSWRRTVRSLVPTSPELTMIDIDERRNRIVIGVETAEDITRMHEKIEALDVPQAAVLVEVVSRITLDIGPPTTGDILDVVRPAIGGVKIYSPAGTTGSGPCTLGFNVLRIPSPESPDTTRFFMTAAHCVAPIGFVDTVEIGQPTANHRLGFEHLDPPTFDWLDNPECTPGATCRYTDAALIRYDYGTTPNFLPFIAWPDSGVSGFTEIRRVHRAFPPYQGLGVTKLGSSTGMTTGTMITGTCQEHFLEGVNYLCLGEADYYSLSGDSGGPVVIEEPCNWSCEYGFYSPHVVFAIGIHKGLLEDGRRVFSPVVEVLAEFQAADPDSAEYSVQSAPLLSTYIAGPTVVPPSSPQEWLASIEGGITPYTYEWYRDGILVGTTSSYSATMPGSSGNFELRRYVYAGDAQIAADTTTVQIQSYTLIVNIGGPDELRSDQICNWVANVPSGNPPYSYQWYRNGSPVGEDDPIFTDGLQGAQSFLLKLVVTDAAQQSEDDELLVTQNESAPECLML